MEVFKQTHASPLGFMQLDSIYMLLLLLLLLQYYRGLQYIIYNDDHVVAVSASATRLFLSDKLLNLLLYIINIMGPAFYRAHDLAHDGSIRPLCLLKPSNCLVDDAVQFGL